MKHYCTNCKINQVKRSRVKLCTDCRPKRAELKIKCRYCNTEVIKYKGEGKYFCNRSCYGKYVAGENNANYKGGITPENRRIRNSPEYKAWRVSVFERDKYTCVECGQRGGTLHADHIKQFAFHPELRLDINNGRTLCLACHKKTDTFMKGNKKAMETQRLKAKPFMAERILAFL